MRLLRTFFIAVFLSATVLGTIVSATEIKSNSIPVVLRMNSYYVLYAYPSAPYINSDNRLMVPLRSISDLLGAETSYNNDTKSATILFDENELLITLDSKTAYLNKIPIEMDTEAILDQNAIFIPIRIIVDSFNIHSSWDSQYRIVTLTDDRIMKTDRILDLEQLDWYHNNVASYNSFLPLHYDLTMTSLPDGKTYLSNTITTKNISGVDVPVGKEDYSFYYIVTDGYFYDSDGGSADMPDRNRPAISKDEVFTRTQDIYINKNERLLYLLVHGRSFK